MLLSFAIPSLFRYRACIDVDRCTTASYLIFIFFLSSTLAHATSKVSVCVLLCSAALQSSASVPWTTARAVAARSTAVGPQRIGVHPGSARYKSPKPRFVPEIGAPFAQHNGLFEQECFELLVVQRRFCKLRKIPLYPHTEPTTTNLSYLRETPLCAL